MDVLQRAEKVQAALYRISEAAQTSEDLVELYRLIHSIISELMPAENLYIALFDDETQLLSFPYYVDEFDTAPSPQKLGRGLTEYILRSGLPLLATPEVYERLLAEGQVDLIGSPSLDWLGAPLKTAKKTIGVMAVQTYSEQVRYSRSDLDVLAFVSTQAAMVIERKQAEAALRDSERRYRLLFENAPVGTLLVNAQGVIVDINPAALKILGSPSREATQQINILTFPPLIEVGFSAAVQHCLESGKTIVAECPYTSKWGKPSFVQYFLTPILNGKGRTSQVQVILEDITERKGNEEQIRKLNRRLQVSSQVNQALVRVMDEVELMQQVCQILIEAGGYPLAWIGVAEQENGKRVHPVAAAGETLRNLQDIYVTWDDSPSGRCPAGTAIRTRKLALSRDALTDLDLSPRRESELEHSFASSVALPLLAAGQAFGALQVFATQPEAFDGAEIQLLTEMSNDLAYGILGIRERIRRQQAEETLRASEEKFANAFQASPDAITINRMSDGMYLDINNGFIVLTGFTREEVLGRTDLELNIWVDPAESDRMTDELKASGEVQNLEAVFRMKDGSLKTGLMSARMIQIHGETCVLSITRDISDLKQVERERARRLVELEAVNHISTALRTVQTLDEMLPRLLDETLEMLGVGDGAIWLFQENIQALQPSVSRGWFAGLNPVPMHSNEGIGGQVFASGQAYRIEDFATDSQTLEANRPLAPSGWGGVCLPIKTAIETIGVFYVSTPHGRPLTPEEVHLLTILSEVAGNAVHRMRLHEQTELHVKRLSSLRTVDMTITSSLDLRITLDILLEQVITQLGTDAADVLLYREQVHMLEYSAGRGWRGSGMRRMRLHLNEGPAATVAFERQIIHIPDLNSPEHSTWFAMFEKEEGFVCYFGVPLIAKGSVKGVLELFHRSTFTPDSEWLEFLETLANQAAIAIDDTQLFDHLQRSNAELTVAYDTTIEGWSRALELRDRETEGHTRRVTEITLELARSMGTFGEEHLVHIRRGALLHDIGKMAIPDNILFKHSLLTEEEWEIMRMHPTYAYDMLSRIAYLHPALAIPLYHHERWDGNGYPKGLKGEEIPFEARIFAVVDVWDALTIERPYREAWSPEKARDYILSNSGTHFDPKVVEGFMKLLETGFFQRKG